MFEEEQIQEILNQIHALCYPQSIPLSGWQMCRAGEKPGPVPESGLWGGHCEYYTFENTILIPEAFAGQRVEFTLLTGKEGEWDATNPQFTVYVNGTLRQGFDVNHTSLVLTEKADPMIPCHILLQAYTGVQNFHLEFRAGLRTVDTEALQYFYDLQTPLRVARLQSKESEEYLSLMPILKQSIHRLDLRRPGSRECRRSIREADRYLRNELYRGVYTEDGQYALPEATSAAAIISNNKASGLSVPASPTVFCVGHTHIDVAWLWTLSVTEDKAVRSFSTVLELMRRYPEYKFMSSQPQLYEYVKKNAPEVYAQIRERVAEGRWETEGGMWVEADCNLASGEALVRQFLVGKNFFRDEFDRDNEILWLPDVFGYSAALPQIMEQCGIRYFMTTKISWNQYNKMPYDTFYWKGIDGTRILTHFIPTREYISPDSRESLTDDFGREFITTYSGRIEPLHIKGAWQRYQQKGLNRETLCAYGYGDGGGGATEEMLETQRRLSAGLPGCPATRPATAAEFFHQMESELTGKKVPLWSGELYLEFHRGTYTSMARNKRWNRQAEFALTNLESESLLAEYLCQIPYPKQMLADSWKVLLRNQFHDILPGSAIREVYEDSKREYAALNSSVKSESELRLRSIADAVGGPVVFNGSGMGITGLVEMKDSCGLCRNLQPTADGTYLAFVTRVPAKGYRTLEDQHYECEPVEISTRRIRTPYADIRLNGKGQITSWYDRTAHREILQTGCTGNVLMTYEDKPHDFDNWNIYDYYEEKCWPVEDLKLTEVIERGPYRYALRLVWEYQDTKIEEILYFYSHTARVDIRFRADWKEDQLLLKALFPLDLNTDEATFEIQYGNVKRPTHRNTSWDQARFEVCCHKWMDVSEGDFGVSFLNDSKYGVSVSENTVGLSLLRCGRYPNPAADREFHEFTYSILPHTGSWKEAGTVRAAYELNNPLKVYCGKISAGETSGKISTEDAAEKISPDEPAAKMSTDRAAEKASPDETAEKASSADTSGLQSDNIQLPTRFSLVHQRCRNISVDVIKRAEKGDGLVVRLYEFENARTDTTLFFGFPVRRVRLCNMMEDPGEILAENVTEVNLTVKPFGIVTLLLEV